MYLKNNLLRKAGLSINPPHCGLPELFKLQKYFHFVVGRGLLSMDFQHAEMHKTNVKTPPSMDFRCSEIDVS